MSYKHISPIPVIEGGTGDLTLTLNGVLIGETTSAIGSTAAGATGQVLTGVTGLAPVWASPAASSISITGDSGGALVGSAFTFTGGTTGITFSGSGSTETLTGTLVVANGGTGAVTLTNHGVLLGQATSAIVATAVGTTGQVFTGVTGSDPVWASPAASSISITGDSGGALTGNAFTFTGGTTGLTFAGSVSTETLGGTLVVSNGGTGNTTFTAYSVITAGTTATGAFQNVSGVGSSGNVLTSNGAGMLPTWQAASAGGITTIDGDTGSVTGSTVNIKGDAASNYAGATVRFIALMDGVTLVLNVTDNSSNTILGKTAGNATISGTDNNGFGEGNLAGLTSGSYNNAFGDSTLATLTSGSHNIGVGFESLAFLDSGSYNIGIGHLAGSSYTTSESSNICIGDSVVGTIAESHTLRIGVATGTGQGQLSSAYIQGIASVVVSNKNYVTINTATGQMGSDSGPSSSFAWSVITANQTAAVNNGYICNKAGTLALALPATSAVGDIIEVTGINTATGWQFTQASGQQIFFGATQTTLGATGTLTSSAIRDALRIVCITANTTWQVLSSIGNISVV